MKNVFLKHRFAVKRKKTGKTAQIIHKNRCDGAGVAVAVNNFWL